MVQSVAPFAPSFSLFNRYRLEDGRQGLNRDALLPIVSFARAMALQIVLAMSQRRVKLEEAMRWNLSASMNRP